MTIISYFTSGTFYEKEAERLRLSCESFGLEYKIEGVAPFGKWHEHVCYKPAYILRMLKELKCPVLWVDADAEIVRKPPLGFPYPLAIRRFDCYPPDHPSYLFASTIYLEPRSEIIQLVENWSSECQKAIAENPDQEISDQPILQHLMAKMNISFHPLPTGYAAIFEKEKDLVPPNELYIVQYQASRLYRKFINGEVVSFGAFDKLSVDELRKLRPKVYS